MITVTKAVILINKVFSMWLLHIHRDFERIININSLITLTMITINGAQKYP